VLTITFSDARFTRTDPHDRFDLLLGVNATINFAVNGRPLFSEDEFPIVELRHALGTWSPSAEGPDFEFESLESEDRPFIWIRRRTSGTWVVGSTLLGLPDSDEIRSSEIASAARGYVDDVDKWVQTNLRVDVTNILG
jgi:hypothetical protein